MKKEISLLLQDISPCYLCLTHADCSKYHWSTSVWLFSSIMRACADSTDDGMVTLDLF